MYKHREKHSNHIASKYICPKRNKIKFNCSDMIWDGFGS